MRRFLALMVSCGLLAAVFTAIVPMTSAEAATAPAVNRLSGNDRYQTAVKISKAGFSAGVPVVYIATGSDYPDALSAAPAAGNAGGPLLLVERNSIPGDVLAELKRLKPEQILVAGGAGVVTNAVFNKLKMVQSNITRLEGSDRYATSRAIVAEAFPEASSLYLATGRDFPDALSAGAAAGAKSAPVLLADGKASSLDANTVNLIKKTGVSTVYIAGGTGVVSKGIEAQLNKVAKVKRLAGNDRYETSVAVNAGSFTTADSAYLATGSSFPDALAGAALAGSKGSPLFVVPKTCVPQQALQNISTLGVEKVSLLGGTGVLTAAVQSLKQCLTAITVAGGDRSITAAWPAVPGAVSYTVEYATSSSLKGSKKVNAKTELAQLITGVSNKTKYYVRVLAIGSHGKTLTTSATTGTTPEAGYPRELKVKVVPAGEHKIKVSWTGQGRATKVGVIAGSEGGIAKDVFKSAWYPATTTSITLTVPTKLRSKLGTGSGNPIHVKVATYNAASAGSSMPNKKNEGAGYRLSLAGSYSNASPTTASGTKLRVATWNVHSEPESGKIKSYNWKDRRNKVATGILKSGASVVGTQELTTGNAGLGNSKTQLQDLDSLLKDYRVAGIIPEVTDGTNGAHLLYEPSTVKVVDSGYVSPKQLLGKTWPAALTNRWFSWAKFEILSSGKQFVAAAVHLPAKNDASDALRVAEAKAIDKLLGQKAGSLPIVLLGDLNSSFEEMPNGAQTTLRDAGYYDASAAAKRSNAKFSTANITNQIDNKGAKGYPFTAYVYKYTAPRIDYVMLKNSPGAFEYVNQIILKSGKFDRTYQGSDHNLQWADIGIR